MGDQLNENPDLPVFNNNQNNSRNSFFRILNSPLRTPDHVAGFINRMPGILKILIAALIAVGLTDAAQFLLSLNAGGGCGGLNSNCIGLGFIFLIVFSLLPAVICFGILVYLKVNNALILSLLGGVYSFQADLFGRTISEHYSFPIVVSVVTTCLLFFLGLLVGYLIFTFIKIPVGLKVVVAVALALAGYFAISEVGLRLDRYFYDNKQQQAVDADIKNSNLGKSSGFDIYAPSYLPNGLKFSSGYLNIRSNGYMIHYCDYGTNCVTFYSFVKPPYFKPPTDCGDVIPNYRKDQSSLDPRKCTIVTKLNNGYNLYLGGLDSNKDYFMDAGGTVVSINTADYKGSLSQQEIINIFNSVQKKTSQELRNLNNSSN